VSKMPPLSDGTSAQTWQAHRAELVRFVTARVSDAAVADDIVHDVLLKALSQLETLNDPAKLRAWLYRITRNAIVDHYRTRRPSEPLPKDLQAEPPEELARAEQELARCLPPLLDALPPQYRQALTLAEVDGLPQLEIARREGLSLSGAKSRVQRARKMARDALLACCQVELDRRGGITGYQPRAECEPCEGSGASCGQRRRPAVSTEE
jgi:RNA polymerase sigma-70 factor, ECF subfamily